MSRAYLVARSSLLNSRPVKLKRGLRMSEVLNDVLQAERGCKMTPTSCTKREHSPLQTGIEGFALEGQHTRYALVNLA